MSRTAEQRRSYSRINPETGHIEWIDPPSPSAADRAARATKIRSRLETDDEVRARLRVAHQQRMQSTPWIAREDFYGSKGRALDKLLDAYCLPARRYVDEVCP